MKYLKSFEDVSFEDILDDMPSQLTGDYYVEKLNELLKKDPGAIEDAIINDQLPDEIIKPNQYTFVKEIGNDKIRFFVIIHKFIWKINDNNYIVLEVPSKNFKDESGKYTCYYPDDDRTVFYLADKIEARKLLFINVPEKYRKK